MGAKGKEQFTKQYSFAPWDWLAIPKFATKRKSALLYHITILLFVLNFHFNGKIIGFEARNDPKTSVGSVARYSFSMDFCNMSLQTDPQRFSQ